MIFRVRTVKWNEKHKNGGNSHVIGCNGEIILFNYYFEYMCAAAGNLQDKFLITESGVVYRQYRDV